MHARVSTIHGTAEQSEAAVRNFNEQVVTSLKGTEGCKGAILLTDRNSGKEVAITLWEDEQAMQTSEEMANALRQQASESSGASQPPTVDRYEVAVWEV